MASSALTIRTKKRNIVEDFARYFGNESQLANWQRLCRDIGLRSDLPSIKKCRAVSYLFMQHRKLSLIVECNIGANSLSHRNWRRHMSTYTIFSTQLTRERNLDGSRMHGNWHNIPFHRRNSSQREKPRRLDLLRPWWFMYFKHTVCWWSSTGYTTSTKLWFSYTYISFTNTTM